MKTIRMTVASLCILFLLQSTSGAAEPQYKIRVNVVGRATPVITYPHRNGSTTVGFRGTSLQPKARGEAKVESKQGYVEIEVEFDDMIPPTRYGPEFLTYVMWSVTPQGRTTNLGEVILNGTKSKLDVTTELETFGMIVTAEPYFAVTQPTDRVVLENYVRPDTRGKVRQVAAKYAVGEDGPFASHRMPRELKPPLIDTTLPLDLRQARHAVRIADWLGIARRTPDLMADIREQLTQAEKLYVGKADKKQVSMASREVVQNVEDARLIAAKIDRDEELARVRRPAFSHRRTR